jgi:hypothetical protein
VVYDGTQEQTFPVPVVDFEKEFLVISNKKDDQSSLILTIA